MLCKDSARREQGKGKASVFIAVAYTLGLPGIAYWMNVISQSGSPGRGRRPKLHSIQFLWFRKGHGAEGPCAGRLEGGGSFGEKAAIRLQSYIIMWTRGQMGEHLFVFRPLPSVPVGAGRLASHNRRLGFFKACDRNFKARSWIFSRRLWRKPAAACGRADGPG